MAIATIILYSACYHTPNLVVKTLNSTPSTIHTLLKAHVIEQLSL